MGGPEKLDDPRNVRAARLRQKLHRELGEVILAALADERVVEVMVNEDGTVWCDRLGEGMSLLPDTLSADRAASLVGPASSARSSPQARSSPPLRDVTEHPSPEVPRQNRPCSSYPHADNFTEIRKDVKSLVWKLAALVGFLVGAGVITNQALAALGG